MHSLKRILFGAALIAAFIQILPAEASADRQKAKTAAGPGQALRHDVSVIVKLVRVVVRDREGRPVMNLTQDDFILLDENVPRKISGFEVHAAAPEVKVPPAPAPDLGLTPLPPRRDLSRTFFILIDCNMNDIWGIGKSCEAAKLFIQNRTLAADEIGLVCILTTGGLDLRVYPTRDHSRVLAALDAVAIVPGMLPTPERDSPPIIFVPFMGGEENAETIQRRMAAISSISASLDRLEAMDHKQRAQVFVRSLSDLAKSMRRVPGTKNMILFTQGIPKPFLKLNNALNERMVSAGREMAAADMPLFSVNSRSGLSETYGAGGQESLRTLSDLTGGRAFDEPGDIAKFERWAASIDEDTRNFYVLGYSVEASWDGSFRRIKVQVRRPGCTVRVQTGYYNPRPYSEYSARDKTVQLLDLALDENSEDRLPVDLPHAVRPAEKGQPPALLVTIPAAVCRTKMSSKSELHVLAVDGNQRIAATYRKDVDLTALPDRKTMAFTLEGLKPGRYDVYIVLRDTATGKGAVATGVLQIGRAEKSF